jgi:phage terminase large subunit
MADPHADHPQAGLGDLDHLQPLRVDDATYQNFHVHPPSDCVRIVTNWRDNVWMSMALLADKDHLFATDPEAAAHVWDGELSTHAEATIFRNKYVVENFETPEGARFYHGAGWGLAEDPTVLVRCYITGKGLESELWIDDEAWGVGIDFAAAPGSNATALCQDIANPNSKPGLFERIPSARKWPIKGGYGRPETLAYVRSVGGYRISEADKWQGSVEDGITHLHGFQQIHIHKDRCPHTAEEFKRYAWCTDRATNEILPIIIDKNHSCIDAIRYALNQFIRSRSAVGVWARLGK